MSQKNIRCKTDQASSRKAKSHDEKSITSSQHSKIEEGTVDQLREEIDLLIPKNDKAKAEAWKSVEEHERLLAKGDAYRNKAEVQWLSYKTWSGEVHRLTKEIFSKLKAIQRYESFTHIKEPKIVKDEDYMKYRPSDDDE